MVRPRTGGGSWKSFLNIKSRVNDEGGEQGLLSMAFPANYSKSGYFFVYYTDSRGDGIVARYKRSGAKASKTEKRYLRIPLGSGDEDAGDNHNGGQLQFGPDGYLYIGVGDGGGGGDPFRNGQNLGTMLGKILRVDVSSSSLKIPKDNPFTDRTGARKEIFFLGLRNPWRFSFDRKTGDLWIGDVGQGDVEEVNLVQAPVASKGGLNFGWNRFEGNSTFSDTALASGTTHRKPNYTYSHATGGCSVTGGYVYRGTRSPGLKGTYVFADYCDAALQGLRSSGSTVKRTIRQGTSFSQISSFGEDGSGELLVAAENRIYRIS
jgi:glucose/arabinose dehydrogenase